MISATNGWGTPGSCRRWQTTYRSCRWRQLAICELHSRTMTTAGHQGQAPAMIAHQAGLLRFTDDAFLATALGTEVVVLNPRDKVVTRLARKRDRNRPRKVGSVAVSRQMDMVAAGQAYSGDANAASDPGLSLALPGGTQQNRRTGARGNPWLMQNVVVRRPYSWHRLNLP
jgi:hypothetical protein